MTAASSSPGSSVCLAGAADAAVVGALLHEFNSEYGDYTPGAAALAERVARLLGEDQLTVLLAGAPAAGLAALRFRPAIFTDACECYLAELYVRPGARRRGLGRALLDAAIELARSRGADRIELATSEEDAAARALYESAGFENRERGPAGPLMYCYERAL